jgi:hypothetical protein
VNSGKVGVFHREGERERRLGTGELVQSEGVFLSFALTFPFGSEGFFLPLVFSFCFGSESVLALVLSSCFDIEIDLALFFPFLSLGSREILVSFHFPFLTG